jgi:hypothetical protein
MNESKTMTTCSNRSLFRQRLPLKLQTWAFDCKFPVRWKTPLCWARDFTGSENRTSLTSPKECALGRVGSRLLLANTLDS